MQIQKINCILCSLTVALAVCGTDANQTHVKCISKYEEFEEESFVKNANNRNLLYKAFYPTNSHPPYSIHVTYQTISPNGTKYHIQVPRYDYVAKTWIWISSPVFLQARPEILNRVILYTLFSFNNWVPPQVTLQVPNPCQNVTFQFLLQMTASLRDYALGNIKKKKHPSNVVIGTAEDSYHKIAQSDHTSGINAQNHYIFTIILSVGTFLQIVLVWMVAVVVLNNKVNNYVNQINRYSYKHYGFMCGLTAVAFILSVAGTYTWTIDVSRIKPRNTNEYVRKVVDCALVGAAILPGIPIAVYFAAKTKPPAVPYIFMVPVAILLCCCNRPYAKSLVFGIALWINMVALQFIVFIASVLAYAVFIKPLLIITNLLILILFAFCLTSIIALMFTISARLFTPKHLRPQGHKATIVRAILLIPLLLAISCHSIVFAGHAYMINTPTTEEGNILALISSFMVPLFIGAVTFGLKKLITKAVETPSSITRKDNIEERDAYMADVLDTYFIPDDDQRLNA